MVPDTESTWTAGEGWAHASIAQTQESKWGAFMAAAASPRPLGQSHEGSCATPPNVASHNTIMSFGYVLGRVAEGRPSISVLDWGGGLGHYYVYSRVLMPNLVCDYVVKDLPGTCAAGRRLLPNVTFTSEADVAFSRRYDLVFASSSMHYSRDPYRLLGSLCASADKWLMITRTPIIEHHDDFVVVQRPHVYGYLSEYPGWFMNRKRLLTHVASQGFVLEREFVVGEAAHVPNAPEDAQYAGFLFRRPSC